MDNNDAVGRNIVTNKKLNWKIISNSLFRFNERVYVFADSPLRYKLYVESPIVISGRGFDVISRSIFGLMLYVRKLKPDIICPMAS